MATTPLTEGVTPPGSQLAKTDYTAKVSQYGDYVHITDMVDLTVEDAVLTEAAELLGEQMGETLDELTRDILSACASSTISSETGQVLSTAEIDGVVLTLLGGNAKMIASVITASTGVGTTPVRPAFFVIAHTDVIDDLEGLTEFQSTAQYPGQQPVMEAEWGAVKNTRWLVSTKGDDTGAGTALDPTYKMPFFGQNAYGLTQIDGSSVKNIVKAFGSAGSSDPLNQRATSGWKATFVARILNDSFMHILEINHS